ncbi:PilZ domain-containing protein [Algicola sagamiensis]|uniref:PilZ domain-containing protein n=1 Tax=Algicola sagamiensis TaxID=163869 RepID=UPI000381A032|nr:PilZ domain-containing protein [Algicola sagamiensis]
MEERRKFTRVIFSTSASLFDCDGVKYETHLLDLSLKGALIEVPEKWECKLGARHTLLFQLAGSDIDIKMQMTVMHCHQSYIGLLCDKLDLDSASHLKRLIELNVGSEELLHRELDQLVQPDEEE